MKIATTVISLLIMIMALLFIIVVCYGYIPYEALIAIGDISVVLVILSIAALSGVLMHVLSSGFEAIQKEEG